MKELNIGVIGTGSIALAHLISLNEIQKNRLIEEKYGTSLEIKTLIDSDKQKVKSLKEKKAFNAEFFSSNPDVLFNDDSIDLVYITTPTKFHLEFYQRALEFNRDNGIQ